MCQSLLLITIKLKCIKNLQSFRGGLEVNKVNVKLLARYTGHSQFLRVSVQH